MYSSTQEIKVDLNQTYEFKYDFNRTCKHQITSQMTYSIDNATYNALLDLIYNDKLIIDKNINATNPLKILDGKEIKTDITTYEICKGKSYKIYINTKIYDLKNKVPEYIHYLPKFSLNFIPLENKTEFGKDITFYRNYNNAFKLIFPEDGGLFIRIDFNISNVVNLKIFSLPYNFCEIINQPGLLHVIPFKKNENIIIGLLYKSSLNEKGILWMHPSTQEIKVYLNQTYQNKYDFKANYTHNKIYQLIYSIDEAVKDIILQFKYNNFFEHENFTANNPLKICHGKKCRSNITNYKISKGESYKIYISTQYYDLDEQKTEPFYFHYLPAFSFNFTYLKPEFGKEITFDMDTNNIFETIFSEDGSLFIRVDFNKSNLLDIIVSSSIDNYNTTIEPPRLQTVIQFKKNDKILINLKYKSDSNETGIIWMYPSTQEIKVNLNKTYEFKYDFQRTYGHQIAFNMTYSINNAEYNALLEFKYNEKLIIDKNINASNPLKIWDGKENKTDMMTYPIFKGKSYKIYINTKIFDLKSKVPEYIHYLPKFSFNFIPIENEPELGKEISFDSNKNAFRLIFPENGGLFIRVDFNISVVYLFE